MNISDTIINKHVALPIDGDATLSVVTDEDSVIFSGQAVPDSLQLYSLSGIADEEETSDSTSLLDLKFFSDQNSFFKDDTLFCAEMSVGRQGIAGDPIPYMQSHDDIITSLLLVFAIIVMLVMSYSWQFFAAQLKNIFTPFKEESLKDRLTSTEHSFLLFLSLQYGVLLSLLYFDYTQKNISDTFVLPTEYHVMAVYLGVIGGYLVLRNVVEYWVNITFFEQLRANAFFQFSLNMSALSGIILLPALFVHVYFGIDVEYVLCYVLFIVIFVKIVTLYQTYRIFFEKNKIKLQIFLYFCMLEILPIMALWGLLTLVANNLTIK